MSTSLQEFLSASWSQIGRILIVTTVGVISVFMYFRNRRKGFLFLGISSILLAIGPLIWLALGGPFIPLILYERGYSVPQIGQYINTLIVLRVLCQIAFSILAVIGLVQFMKPEPQSAR